MISDPGRWWRETTEALGAALAVHGPAVTAGGIAGLLAVTLLAQLVRARRRARWAAGARWVEITAPPKVEPGSADLLWSNLGGLLRPPLKRAVMGQPPVAFEIHADTERLRFGIWVPGTVSPGLVEHAVRAAWPGAQTTTHRSNQPSPLPQPGPGQVLLHTAGRLRLASHESLPLRTERDTDPLRQLLGALEALPTGQSACVQVMARPATGSRARAARRAGKALLDGRPARLHTRVVRALLGLLHPATTSSRQARSTNPLGELAPHRAALGRAVAAKTGAGQLWAVQARYIATATTPTATAGQPTESVTRATSRGACDGRAEQLSASFGAYTGHNRLRRRRLWRRAALVRRWMGRGQLWSTPELAALAHLPLDVRVAGLARAGAATVAPPPGIPTIGSDTKILGVAQSGTRRPVGITVADSACHLHLLGRTGSGKSTTEANLALADIHAGRGTAVLDPKGDLARDIDHRLTPDELGRVVRLDPDAPGPVPTLNLLDPTNPNAVDYLVGICSRIYQQYWGPRIEEALRNGCLTEVAYYHHRVRLDPNTPLPHLGDVVDLFDSDAHRSRATAHLDTAGGRHLRGFWAYYNEQTPAGRHTLSQPLLSKLRGLLLRPFAAAVLTGTGPPLDMAAVLNRGRICLARLPEGTLGLETTRLLGSLLVARAWQAATARAALPEHARAHAALYLDECQQFLNMPVPMEDLLAQARGYRLSLVLAHQNLAQLPRELREAISANAASKLFFQVSPEDAHTLERHVYPHLTAHDLAHLGPFTAAARLHVNGAPTAPFTLSTYPLPPALTGPGGPADPWRAAA